MGGAHDRGIRTREVLLFLNSNVSIDGIVEATGVDNTASPGVRVELPIYKGYRRGWITKIVVTITSKAGTQVTDIDVRLLDNAGATANVAGINLLFESTGDTVNGTTVPDTVINHVPPEKIPFAIRGTNDSFEMTIFQNGADATTSYTYQIQVFGEVAAS